MRGAAVVPESPCLLESGDRAGFVRPGSTSLTQRIRSPTHFRHALRRAPKKAGQRTRPRDGPRPWTSWRDAGSLQGATSGSQKSEPLAGRAVSPGRAVAARDFQL